MKKPIYKEKLRECGLRVTPQRMAVLDAIDLLHNHPTAEEITHFIHKNHPNIASGTVYKTLETLCEKDIIKRVKTDHGVMRYDDITEEHHHLYCSDSDRIEDYYDEELTLVLTQYFKKKKIPDFMIEDIKLQLVGKFTESTKK